MADMMNPPPSLLCKLASVIVHAEEFMSPHGHEFDKEAFDQLLKDREVAGWLQQMTDAAMAPRKRNA